MMDRKRSALKGQMNLAEWNLSNCFPINFHGKGPGKMKQKKRMKQYQEELKMNNSDTFVCREDEGSSSSRTLVLSGHVKGHVKPGCILD
ncbi:hypothetical protein BT93_E1911 [Corymbia citriodora subsp. variegata]|nr:hypothetical protein BT93_E1911 [Corymbia citriodora subsp. variegata]